MFHTFENSICTVCGEHLDYLIDSQLREQAFIGPKLPVDDYQGTFPLTVNVMVPTW